MTTLWTAEAAAAATGSQAQGRWQASGVSIDSRSIAPGDLFVAIRGPNTDGHLYVRQALEAGAAAAMVAADWNGITSEAGEPLLVVADTMDGLNALARAARARSAARIAAVTGSVGKTSTKDALAHVLAAQGPTEATRGNLNNQWGLPLSLSRMPEDARYGVFELGMNHAGELTPLSQLLRPDVAIVTTVESVHLEFFASEEAIADAKAEIFAGMDSGGAALLNIDNQHFGRLAQHAREAGVGRVLSFGAGEGADFRLLDWHIEDGGNHVDAEIDGDPVTFRTGAPGRHWATIGVCVLGAAHLLGADVAAAARSLAGVMPPRGRGSQAIVDHPGGGTFVVIDESYNASPASMKAAFGVLGAMQPGPGGRRIAVLGDMLELGPDSPALHAGLAEPLREARVDLVFAAGPNMARLIDTLPPSMRGAWAESSAGLAGEVTRAVRGGDVVTVKGSLGSRMAPVVEALLALGQVEDGGNAARKAAGRG